MVLDCVLNNGIESSNSKPTLLEDQTRECQDVNMDEQEALCHGTSWKPLTWLVATVLSGSLLRLLLYGTKFLWGTLFAEYKFFYSMVEQISWNTRIYIS